LLRLKSTAFAVVSFSSELSEDRGNLTQMINVKSDRLYVIHIDPGFFLRDVYWRR